MANTRFQICRSSIAGRKANSTYIHSGELGLNMADQILYSLDTSNNVFIIGANIVTQSVTNNIFVGNSTNGILGNSTVLSVGNSTVYTTVNSSTFSGTSNNTAFVGSITAANVVSNAQLSANLSNYVSKTATEQVISGGATVTSYNLGITNSTVNSITIDSGKCPLQYLTNNSAFTCIAPSNDGSCIVQILNGTAANTITFSGWQVSNVSGTGDVYSISNGSIFNVQVLRINGNSNYIFKQIK